MACGTFQIWSVDIVDQHEPKKEMTKFNPSNKQIKELYEKVLVEIQGREGTRGAVRWLPCPTCTEFLHGAVFDTWVRDMGALRFLPCLPVKYEVDEEDAETDTLAVYRDDGEIGRPKWNLVEGIGPSSLEIDKHCPFRLPAPQFKKLLPFATKHAVRPLRVNENADAHIDSWKKFLRLVSNARDILPPDINNELLDELVDAAEAEIPKSKPASKTGAWVGAPWLARPDAKLQDLTAIIDGYIENYKLTASSPVSALSPAQTPRQSTKKSATA